MKCILRVLKQHPTLVHEYIYQFCTGGKDPEKFANLARRAAKTLREILLVSKTPVHFKSWLYPYFYRLISYYYFLLRHQPELLSSLDFERKNLYKIYINLYITWVAKENSAFHLIECIHKYFNKSKNKNSRPYLIFLLLKNSKIGTQ